MVFTSFLSRLRSRTRYKAATKIPPTNQSRRNLHFLELPPEIRLLIYEYALDEQYRSLLTMVFKGGALAGGRKPSDLICGHYATLQVCRLIRSEALEVLYKKSTIALEIGYLREFVAQVDVFETIGHQFRSLRIDIDPGFGENDKDLIEYDFPEIDRISKNLEWYVRTMNESMGRLVSKTRSFSGLRSITIYLHPPRSSNHRRFYEHILRACHNLKSSDALDIIKVHRSVFKKNGKWRTCIENTTCDHDESIQELKRAMKGMPHSGRLPPRVIRSRFADKETPKPETLQKIKLPPSAAYSWL